MSKTAVEFLLKKLLIQGYVTLDDQEKAKEMEKQQITNAYWDGGQDIPLTENRCEQYYNETFKTN